MERESSEGRRAREDSRNSEEWYRTLFERAQDGIGLADAETGILVDCNVALCRLVERDRAELVGRPQSILHPPQEVTGGFSRTFRQHQTLDPALVLETNLLSKSGMLIPVEIRAARIRMNGCAYILGIFRDIRQRKSIEAALLESEKKYREMAEMLPEPLFECSLAGNITYANEAAFERFGYDADDLARGVNIFQMIAPDEVDRAKQNLGASLEAGKIEGHEYTARRKNGDTFSVVVYAGVVMQNGRPAGVRGILVDVTERRKLEKEMARIASEERQKVGRDLHDMVCQQLSGIALLAKTLQIQLAKASRAEAEGASMIVQLLSQATEMTRKIAMGISPVSSEPDGLARALDALALNVSAKGWIKCRLVAQDEVQIEDSNTATQLYFIALEAVNNAIKHGRARTIDLILSSEGRRVSLTVRNDGAPLASGREEQGGMGIEGMRHRAETIGATFEMRSIPGGGAIVECIWDRK